MSENNIKMSLSVDKKDLQGLVDNNDRVKSKSPIIEKMTLLVAVLALIFSSVLTGVTIFYSDIHNRQSVMPLLSAWHSESEDKKIISWGVYNAGLGPAIIKEAEAFICHDARESTCDEKSDAFLGEYHVWDPLRTEGVENINVSWEELVVTGDIIKDGDDLDIVKVQWKDKIPMEYDADKHLVLAYCYCSVYEDCYYSDTRSKRNKYDPLLNCK
ncbi:hypothetical protein [Vibrio scophthalmi]|uniref:Uncharacterized protein n=1 Tax=Vibrio scophthalmi TaxID=45658 RepID=A0A1E3WJ54_9VIBR|nr:hypothetical protein [Vibrio scophthalmi]ODS05047.1 hypothetical protein VSF3289_04187 [Vibrio scophthalmi]